MSDLLKNLEDRLEILKGELQSRFGGVSSSAELEDFQNHYFGKKGLLSELMKGLAQLTPEEKPRMGSQINEFRSFWLGEIQNLQKKFQDQEKEIQLRKEKIDVTLSGRSRKEFAQHPVSMVQEELVRILENCGFSVEMGPELEHEFFNFDALNIPPGHPARAMQDTFYIEGFPGLLLRTQTSTTQIRTMLGRKPPIRMISPGRVFRADYDATHTPMFHQIEGLLVDESSHMGHLKGILSVVVEKFFGTSLKIRLRPSFFPFTEPSAEIDMECCFCRSQGCSICKQSGWIEIAGCGMVDPEVFKAVGLDTEKYRGFAFGMGLERMTMLKFGVSDLRAFFESDERFIRQLSRFRGVRL